MKQKELLPIVAAAFFIYLITRPKKVSGSPITYPNTIPSVPALPPGTTSSANVPGSAGETYLGISTLPRGIRNNNPGNFKMSSSAWQGKIPQQDNTDGTFQQYYFFPFGVRMMIKELKNNYINNGYNTIETLIKRYAPTSGQSYIEYVANRMGKLPTDELNGDKKTLLKLVQAIARFENGYTGVTEAVSVDTFNYAYSLI